MDSEQALRYQPTRDLLASDSQASDPHAPDASAIDAPALDRAACEPGDGDASGVTGPRPGWMRPRAFTVILSLLTALMLAASVYTALLIRDRQRTLSEISRYNVTWATSQAALEVARLENTLASLALAGPGGDPSQAQIWFDIVANRVQILGHGEAGELIRGRADLSDIYDGLKSRMAAAEKLIDHAEQPGVARQLIGLIAPLAAPMARLAGAAHDSGGNLVAADLAQLRDLHFVFSAMLVALIACCIGLIGVLGLNNRMLSRAHREVAALVVDLRRAGRELGAAHDATRRAASEVQLQNKARQARDFERALQNTRFDAALNNMSQALCMVGQDGRLIVCNRQFRELFGAEAPVAGAEVSALFDDIIQAGRLDAGFVRQIWLEQQALLQQHLPGGFYLEGHDTQGQMRAIAVAHEPMTGGGWVATYSDITGRRIAETQLAQAQKMEAIGNLTGGMAHDFNNLLAVISLNLEYMLGRVENHDAVREHAGRALQASLRGADLISQLLAFARRQPLAPQRIAVNTWIRSILGLMGTTLGEAVTVRLELGEAIWPVSADPIRLETAIANLATNARDAMGQGGELIISTRNCSLDPEEARRRQDVAPGDYVVIEVADTGAGMAPEVAAHIFEPFFSTKDQGHGTGLGLSMVFGFIRQSGGHITVTTAPGAGTLFCLHLPRAEGDPVGEIEVVPHPALVGGSETILVVEDNEAVRQVTTDLLEQLGYGVIATDSPQQALALLQTDRTVDLLFSDVVMPGGMDGFALVQAAIRLRPGLRLLLASGFAEFAQPQRGPAACDPIPKPGAPGAVAEAGLEPGAAPKVRVLGKPFRQSELATALREVLDAG